MKQKHKYLKRFSQNGEKFLAIKLPTLKQIGKVISVVFLVIGLFNVVWILFVTPILSIVSFAWLYYQQTGNSVFLQEVLGIVVRWVISLLLTALGIIGYKISKWKRKK